ncbi:eclosion hormone [Onthophagus taurus]|uniref:eclosion hormone n=1 Tax=Onthophagus taurus TaxID=166361 RepID=UPI000C201ED6|nr:eclosion hormone [Onthophagus taurus]
MNIFSVILILSFILFYGCDTTEADSVPVCIRNCVQCKQMLGVYFQGRACGDSCVVSNGREVPDCNNPRTLGVFLKRFL